MTRTQCALAASAAAVSRHSLSGLVTRPAPLAEPCGPKAISGAIGLMASDKSDSKSICSRGDSRLQDWVGRRSVMTKGRK